LSGSAPPPLALISWPYEQGSPDFGMGAGATRLATDEELHAALAGAGWAPTLQRVTAADPMLGEAGRTFDLLRAQEEAVRDARARGAFPLVLSGGCISAAGTVAGCGVSGSDGAGVGVVWLDAHADMDTPEDNLSGSLDVMSVSILTGSAWPALRRTLAHPAPVREEHVAMLGVRDLAEHQRARLERFGGPVVGGAFTGAGAHDAIAFLPPLRYLHIDLDVLDTSVGKANRYACDGGPSLEAVLAAVDATFATGTVLAAALTAYEPSVDPRRRIHQAATTIATHIARHALAQRRPS
jgi:arginase